MQRLARCLVLALVLLWVLGCDNPRRGPTPTPTKTPRPTVQTSMPTPIPPTSTPTDTPFPTATPTPTATLGLSLIIPGNDPGISPFTGLRPADPLVLERRPLAIKVANTANVRPQSGLSKADVVVESRVEFNVTRFTAIYHSQDAERVGSIRSARLIDVELPVIFDAVLCFSGGVEPVRQRLYNSDIGDHILEQARNGAAYFRDPNIPVPHNLFANTATLWRTVTQRGWNQRPRPTAAWVFSEVPPEGGAPARQVDIPYPDGTVRWVYDAATGRWKRFVRGEPHVEALDGQQLTAADVVILAANHVPTLILEHGTKDIGINRSIEIQLWGQGPLKVLRDGRVYEGMWVRPERHAPFRFVDAAGNDIPLKPGNSWWQVIPLDMSVTISQ
ncbi:MAG: DUF3048 domain-containing protein [Anaerolineae bacterium]|nr:DUF3048 domain-containing protein [Anaerolineae bacterium]MDW8100014.1 DUF3048 domain-containing protein [Anaerolineae bacterium]